MDEYIEGLQQKYNWNQGNYDYNDTFLDREEFDALNENLINAGKNLRMVNKKMTQYEEVKVQLEIKLTHTRREFLEKHKESSMTETQKKLLADIECEDYEFQIKYIDTKLKELTRLSFSIRTEIDILQTLGHNIRREMTL